MSMFKHLSGAALCRSCQLCLLCLSALAAQPAAAQQQAVSVKATAPDFGVSLTDDRLGANRGGSDLMKTEMSLSGTTAHNNAEQVYTGGNTISAGSFANTSGIPIVIQNSGANVLIQNATILNLQMR